MLTYRSANNEGPFIPECVFVSNYKLPYRQKADVVESTNPKSSVLSYVQTLLRGVINVNTGTQQPYLSSPNCGKRLGSDGGAFKSCFICCRETKDSLRAERSASHLIFCHLLRSC